MMTPFTNLYMHRNSNIFSLNNLSLFAPTSQINIPFSPHYPHTLPHRFFIPHYSCTHLNKSNQWVPFWKCIPDGQQLNSKHSSIRQRLPTTHKKSQIFVQSNLPNYFCPSCRSVHTHQVTTAALLPIRPAHQG